jgi:polyhydroxybutyrate depolymerase
MRDPVVGDRSAGGPRAEASARRRRLALSAVIVCITLPGAAAFVEGVTFYGQNRSTDFISVGEWKRGYVLHVPEDLDRSQPVPLIISLHGGFLWGATQRDISRWNDVADREGFIVAYPSGAGRASPRRWRGDPDDVEFITRLIDTLVTVNDVDPDRVYADGLSNGGGMAFALSCAIPDRIAAVGIVAGALTTASWGWEACAHAPPTPAVFVHGTADSAAPYHGGETWVAPQPFPSIPAWVAGGGGGRGGAGGLGPAQRVRGRARELGAGGRPHQAHLPWVRGRRRRPALHAPRRRPRVAGRRPLGCRVAAGNRQPEPGRHRSALGFFPGSTTARSWIKRHVDRGGSPTSGCTCQPRWAGPQVNRMALARRRRSRR